MKNNVAAEFVVRQRISRILSKHPKKAYLLERCDLWAHSRILKPQLNEKDLKRLGLVFRGVYTPLMKEHRKYFF